MGETLLSFEECSGTTSPSCSCNWRLMRFLGEMRSKLPHLACFHGGPHLHKWLDKWWINKFFFGFSSVFICENSSYYLPDIVSLRNSQGSCGPLQTCNDKLMVLMVWKQHQPIPIMYFKSCSDFIIMHSSDFNKMACNVLWATIQNQLRPHFLFTTSANLLLQAWGCKWGEKRQRTLLMHWQRKAWLMLPPSLFINGRLYYD